MPMKRIVGFSTLILLVSCASHRKLITPEQVTWIKNGETTRGEVLKRLGPSNFP